jgi:hypothetical protein
LEIHRVRIRFGRVRLLGDHRTMDLLAGAEYFSKRGWAPQGEFRARPSERSFVDLNFFSVFDRGILQPDPNAPPNTTPQLVNVDQAVPTFAWTQKAAFITSAPWPTGLPQLLCLPAGV